MAEYMQYEWKSSAINPQSPRLGFNPYQKPDNKSALQDLRHKLNVTKDIELKVHISQDDATLTKFLNARNYDVEETYQLIYNYYWYKQRNDELLFRDLDISAPDIRDCIENCLPGVLTSKDRKGRCVIILNANNWECTYTLISIYRALLFTLDYLANDLHNQTNGFVIIVDWTEFSFRKTTHLKPAMLRLMIEGLQDCIPVKFKGIHFLGQSWYVEAALTVIKPFFKESIKEKIYVHGNNLSHLHELVHKDILPAELGGEQPSYNPESWLKIIESRGKII